MSKEIITFFVQIVDSGCVFCENFSLGGLPLLAEMAPMTFAEKLVAWYHENKRDLPWRRSRDPYFIWLSEIILQQTRVEQGFSYYLRFIEYYPTVKDLALATEDEVLKLWQGLGYYSRARNMHATARHIVSTLNGVFPNTYEGLRALKGVGDYTAAAIGSIAFNLPVPVVDGNVLRFMTRLFGIKEPINLHSTHKMVREIILEMIPADDPGSFNQAMMEFGAMFCKPSNPDCKRCLFSLECDAYSHQMVDQLPVKTKPPQRRIRYFHYLVMFSSDRRSVILKRREGKDIWHGLYDFPLIETSEPLTLESLTTRREWKRLTTVNTQGEVRIAAHQHHILTHQTIVAVFYELIGDATPVDDHFWIEVADYKRYPVPRLIDRYLQNSTHFHF